MYTFYEYPKCTTCKKAKAELKALGVEFEAIDIKENPPQVALLTELVPHSHLDLKKFFNTSGNAYRNLGLKERFSQLTEAEAIALLAADGMLIKRPILLKDGQLVQIGYRKPYKEIL